MRRIGTSVWVSLGLVILLSAIAAPPAAAQARAGVQGGMSLDPDQVFFGGHVQTSPLIESLRFRPGVDIGLGDDITLVGFNFDFTYTFSTARPWNLYAGAGPAINWVDTDFGSDTEGGFNFLVGARQSRGTFFEMRVGVLDSPDLKFGVGYTF
jgi:hypothetical protein